MRIARSGTCRPQSREPVCGNRRIDACANVTAVRAGLPDVHSSFDRYVACALVQVLYYLCPIRHAAAPPQPRLCPAHTKGSVPLGLSTAMQQCSEQATYTRARRLNRTNPNHGPQHACLSARTNIIDCTPEQVRSAPPTTQAEGNTDGGPVDRSVGFLSFIASLCYAVFPRLREYLAVVQENSSIR